MRFFHPLTIVFFSFFVYSAFAQSYKITGNVSTDNTPVKYALITFINQSDTTELFSAVTDSAGYYSVDILTNVKEQPIIPQSIELMQNYPNPFSDNTEIPYQINSQADINIKIYNILGQEVKAFNIGTQFAGLQSVKWDGKNNAGQRVTAGVYFYQLLSGKEIQVKKMLLNYGTANFYSGTSGKSLFKTGSAAANAEGAYSKFFIIKIINTDSTEPKISTLKSVHEISNNATLNFSVDKVTNEILYIEDSGEPLNGSLFITDLDQTYHKKIIDSVYTYGTARWSPDGQWIAYEGKYNGWEDEDYDICLVKADGTDRRIITGNYLPRGGIHPVWSPDGNKIAFSKSLALGSNYEIFILELDSTQIYKEVRLTYNFDDDYVYDWSPDGSKIVFRSNVNMDSLFDFYKDWYTIDTTGKNKTLLLENDSSFSVFDMRFSPDGNHIVCSKTDGAYIMDKDGTNMKKISSINEDISNMAYQISWSPDGKYIICPGLYLINSDGSGYIDFLIPDNPNRYLSPDWRPVKK